MPWRLIQFIVLFVIFLIFIGLNLDNKCDIRYGFTENAKIGGVPVFFTAFFSFIVGMLCALPFIFRKRKKAGDVKGKGLLVKAAGKQADSLADKSNYGID